MTLCMFDEHSRYSAMSVGCRPQRRDRILNTPNWCDGTRSCVDIYRTQHVLDRNHRRVLGIRIRFCATLISLAGAVGGVVNALLTSNGFILPRREKTILLPGLAILMVGRFLFHTDSLQTLLVAFVVVLFAWVLTRVLIGVTPTADSVKQRSSAAVRWLLIGGRMCHATRQHPFAGD